MPTNMTKPNFPRTVYVSFAQREAIRKLSKDTGLTYGEVLMGIFHKELPTVAPMSPTDATAYNHAVKFQINDDDFNLLEANAKASLLSFTMFVRELVFGSQPATRTHPKPKSKQSQVYFFLNEKEVAVVNEAIRDAGFSLDASRASIAKKVMLDWANGRKLKQAS